MNPLRWPSIALLTLLLPTLFTATAHAQAPDMSVVQATLVRQWDIPFGTSPYLAPVDTTVDGITLMTLGRGDEEEELCIIAVADEERARAYKYRHEFSATRCLDATPHPDGGFFVRGESPLKSDSEPAGFTARIDEDGEILWSLSDEALVQALPPPAGPGELLGNYGHPLPGLVYDHTEDRLMALVLGEHPLATGARPVMQAFIIRGESGELLLNGRVFGPNRNDIIVETITRQGDFLLRTEGFIDKETRFYIFDGRKSASLIRPGDKNWSQRQLLGSISYHPLAGTLLLSTPGPTLLAIADDEEAHELWTKDLSDHHFGDTLGHPIQAWAGSEMIALLYERSDSESNLLRLLNAEDGQDLALAEVSELILDDLIDLTRGPAGELRLLAIQPAQGYLREYELHLRDSSEPPIISDPGTDQSGGCAHPPTAPPPSLLLLIPLLALSFHRRNAKRRAA